MYPSSKTVPSRPGNALARRLLVLPLLLALLGLAAAGCSKQSIVGPEVRSSARAAAADLKGALADAAPVHLEGVMDSGALWAIDRPANWNGDLVVYAHGYVNPADPLAMPNYGELRDSLMARGFGVAATSYSNNGYAVQEGVRETHALRALFTDNIGKPEHTFLMGRSLGGIVSMVLTQKFTTQFDGSLLVAGVVGGTEAEVQYMGDIRVLFDAVYGPGVLGGSLYHPVPVTNPNVQVVGPALAAINANPQGVGIIQALARRPLAGNNGQEIVTSLLTMLVFAAEGGEDLFDRAHQLSYFDNAGYTYASPFVPAQVAAGVNAAVSRYAREPGAEQYLTHWGSPEGPFRTPVLTMHTTRDPVVPLFHEDLLAASAAGPNLRQYRTDRYGHDKFSAGEIMGRFSELVTWTQANEGVLATR